MKRILQCVWKYKLLVILPTLAMLINIGLDMFNPYLPKLIIDRVIGNNEYNLLMPILLALTGITVARVFLGYAKEYLFDLLSTKVHGDLKNQVFNHIESLSFSYFDGMNTGELMSRIGEDVENIWRTISFGLRLFVENVIYFIAATAILFLLEWRLALITIVAMPIIAFMAMKFEKEIGASYGKLSDQGVVLNTTAQENIAGVRLVKAFAREKHEIYKFLEMNNKNYDLNMEQANIFAKFLPPMDLVTNIVTVLVIILGGIFVIKNQFSLGSLVAFNGYIWMLVNPMRMLGWLTNLLSQNIASVKKIDKILNTEPSIKDAPDAVHLSEVKGHIQFNNVSFKYKEDYVLKNINLDAKAGSTIAIMGTTGSGKSSIINLIGRYYDVTDGEILVDGFNVKKLNMKDLRRKMSIVPQDTFLFSESIEENIKFGKENATMDEIKAACTDACADEFIYDLSEGFDTVVGERGIGLSGGQKQRISIARALIRDSSILILDDATSALDTDTEYNLLNNLNHREKKATTFIIAHRISAVKNADEILYVDNGEIVERGTHEQLLKKQGRYYEIYCEQFKDFEDVEGEVI